MHLRSIHFFKFTKYSHIAEVLTLSDVLYWGGDTFVSVVLALFVTQYIDGATASSVGIAYMIYRLASSLSTAYVGRMFDSIKGYLDEIWALFAASILAGITYILLSSATQLWHLYLAMGIVGICRSFDVNAWKMIFYTHLETKKKGRTIGTYDAIYGVAMGAIAALSGFVGEIYGFRNVILIAGVIVILGAIPVLSLRNDEFVK
ncbi:MFS transporter [Patescibacteria group bacterium]